MMPILLVLMLEACTSAAANQEASCPLATPQLNSPPKDIVTVIPAASVAANLDELVTDPEIWSTFNNYEDGYSIQYPQTYSIVADRERNGWISLYDGQDTAVISIGKTLNDMPGNTPSKWIDQIGKEFSDFFIYRVTSRTDLMWQGLYPACEWTSLVQSCADIPPLISEKHLYLLNEGYKYQVDAWTFDSEYKKYSSIFDRIIASFRITQN